MCSRRFQTAICDGAYLILGTLQESFWALSEKVDLDVLDTPQAFDHLIKLLDGHFKYETAVEVPDTQEKVFFHIHEEEGRDPSGLHPTARPARCTT